MPSGGVSGGIEPCTHRPYRRAFAWVDRDPHLLAGEMNGRAAPGIVFPRRKSLPPSSPAAVTADSSDKEHLSCALFLPFSLILCFPVSGVRQGLLACPSDGAILPCGWGNNTENKLRTPADSGSRRSPSARAYLRKRAHPHGRPGCAYPTPDKRKHPVEPGFRAKKERRPPGSGPTFFGFPVWIWIQGQTPEG